jgi:hypothetical protein
VLSRRPARQVPPLDVRPLTSEIGLFWSPRLSPDGQRLVYVRRITGSADLILRNTADGEKSPLHPTPANEYSPAWSPDGSVLAFLRQGSGATVDLIVMSMQDGTERRIAQVAPPTFGAPHFMPPHLDWSPDGSFLVVPERTSQEGFFPPVQGGDAVNNVNAGRTIPLKWRVLDAQGEPVATLTSVSITVQPTSCWDPTAAGDATEAESSSASGFQNQGDGYYQFNWETSKNLANSCATLHLDLGDGVDHTALFMFR